MYTKIEKETKTSSDKSKKVVEFIALVIGELVLLFFLFFFTYLQDPGLKIMSFHDSISACIVVGAPLIMLLITGLMPDFLRSFVYTLKQREEITAVQIKKSLFSVKLAMITAVVSQLLMLAYCFVSMMNGLDLAAGNFELVLAAGMGVFGGMAIYGILPVIILLPVYARLKVRLISMQ